MIGKSRGAIRLLAISLVFIGAGFVGEGFVFGQDASPVKTLILPGESFLVNGRPAFILWPAEEKRRHPQPWVFYAPTLPAYPDSHEKWMHEQFLAAGVAVAGIDVGEAYGSPAGHAFFDALYRELTAQRGFADKPCLLGRSRGGLWVTSWASRNPEKVAGLAGIYPVFDLRTYPGLQRAAPAYGLSPAQLESQLQELNPISGIDKLALANVPVFIIHGDIDKVVPLRENSATLLEHYRRLERQDLVELIVPEGQGHNFWPGFFRCGELVDFTIRRAKQGAGDTDSPSRPASNTVTYKDLEYHRVDARSLLLDLYRPRTASSCVPVVVWVHGGGWKGGSKERCPAAWLAERGYAVASINYRLSQEAQWPAQIDDCRAAIRWLRANAEAYGLDDRNIAAWGGSAGGHLVALLGTQDVPAEESISSRVRAVCDWYGPTDLLTMPANVLGPGKTLADLAESNGAKLLGGTVRDRPELARNASALHHISPGDAPFLIMHGSNDAVVPLEQSQRFHEQLTKSGVASTFHIIEGAGHGGKEFQSADVRERVLDFFNLHLKTAE